MNWHVIRLMVPKANLEPLMRYYIMCVALYVHSFIFPLTSLYVSFSKIIAIMEISVSAIYYLKHTGESEIYVMM